MSTSLGLVNEVVTKKNKIECEMTQIRTNYFRNKFLESTSSRLLFYSIVTTIQSLKNNTLHKPRAQTYSFCNRDNFSNISALSLSPLSILTLAAANSFFSSAFSSSRVFWRFSRSSSSLVRSSTNDCFSAN